MVNSGQLNYLIYKNNLEIVLHSAKFALTTTTARVSKPLLP